MGRITGLKVIAAIVDVVSLAGAGIAVAAALRYGDAGTGVLAGLLLAVVLYGDLLVVRAVRAVAELDEAAAVRAADGDAARLDACLGVDEATGEGYASMLATFLGILEAHPDKASTLDGAYHSMQSRLAAGLPVEGEFRFDADGNVIEGEQC